MSRMHEHCICERRTDSVFAVGRQNAEHHDVQLLRAGAVRLEAAADGADRHVVVADCGMHKWEQAIISGGNAMQRKS